MYKDDYTQAMQDSMHISGVSAEYVDYLYELYNKDRNAVDGEWQNYFDSLTATANAAPDVSHADIRAHFAATARSRGFTVANTAASSGAGQKQGHVLQLINAHRTHGHHLANLDPLGLAQRLHIADLDIEHHHLSPNDFDTTFSSESYLTNGDASLREIFKNLRDTYCGSIGIEYMHISNNAETAWLQQRLESARGNYGMSAAEKRKILENLTAADGLEKYLGSKYVGQKRFSLEGGDSLIPMMYELINRAGKVQVREVIVGMAHRGRLNVLVNVLGKSPEELFSEFEGKKAQTEFTGDVKYHMGFSSDIATEKDCIHLSLAFNPSHLEIVAPVVQGSVRARMCRRADLANKKLVVPVIIHGDAAFAGQGVVMETFNFSQARGYGTGGTVHIVINNQVGFTMSNPLDARSTLYCTDVAKMVQAPIIHVNGNDPEAVVFATRVAFDFRMQFKKDVVIDLVCYRRHGHNEADEPSVTQPQMYEVIRSMPTPRELYAAQLVKENVLKQADADALVSNYRDQLDRGEHVVKTVTGTYHDEFVPDWKPYAKTDWRDNTKTGVKVKQIEQLAKRMAQLPESFTLHPVVQRLQDERLKMATGEIPMNWGFAEIMAYASLITEGYPLRLSGQDSGRGTFAHRHAVMHDYKTDKLFIPLAQLGKGPDHVVVIDSVLSEEAVLGFEYGYSASEPNALVIWEAQFGDFANGAQVVIDQFISSGEQKWGRYCGLTLFLPHGYEGQGPEHSSARLERYLQLCAQHNMQVCVPTTPAQVFHMLRRQMLRPYRKPLVVMTPKSLLRHKLAVSQLSELQDGSFAVIIPEIDDIKPASVRKIVLCSGKVYYDLLEARRQNKQTDVAIIRVEQLYPFPREELTTELQRYAKAKDIVWCQEEPKNQGAWYPTRHNIEECLTSSHVLHYAGRSMSASPAVGYLSLHVQQQKELVAEALR